VLGAFWLAVGVFYLVVRNRGAQGVRTEGRTLLDKPEENPPKE
jgi:hypothetical protein